MKNRRTFYVLGGANIDMLGKSIANVRTHDSNPGHITVSFGGVARNIAENLSRMGANVVFMSVFGDDSLGLACQENLKRLGIDISYSVTLSHRSSSSYMAIVEPSGEMICAVADMNLLESLTQQHLLPFLQKITEDDILIMDTNLSEELIDFITSSCAGKIAVDPISVAKSSKIQPFLSRVAVFKPNLLEAEKICGYSITDDESLMKAMSDLLKLGIEHVIISLGSQGGMIGTKKCILSYHHKEFDIISTTGAGDAFLASYIKHIDLPIEQLVRVATSAALLTCHSESTVSSVLSEDLLDEYIAKYPIDVEFRTLKRDDS